MTVDEILDELKRINDAFEPEDSEAVWYRSPESLVAELIRDITRDKYLEVAS